MTTGSLRRLRTLAAATVLAAATLSCDDQAPPGNEVPATTATPIKHVIIVVGENHSFDNLFGTYQPRAGQTIDNLLSKGIVREDGSPGAHFDRAQQLRGLDTDTYQADTASTGAYETLPRPSTTAGIGLPQWVPDMRFPADLPNGPYQISRYAPYDAYTGDPVHDFFQMWQGVDGGRMDKFVWVEETSSGEGSISMGFYNMNPYHDVAGNSNSGDAPIFKALADRYAISDNFHQAVMGGTGVNFQALVSGDAAFYTNTNLDGTAAVPFEQELDDPDPAAGTNNSYTRSGAYVSCADDTAPGIAAVREQLRRQGVERSNCAPGHYYLITNRLMYWDQTSSRPEVLGLGPDSYTLPPQSNPTIADVMTAHGISWKYYSGGRGDDPVVFASSVDGVPVPFQIYCGLCDPLTGYSSIMQNPAEEAKLQSYGAFLDDVHHGTVPAVSFVRPFSALTGHPGFSTGDLYEQFLQDLIDQVQSDPELWASTAIFITTDEGGGYYDSGYIQALDFFGDGTRIPLIAVSPFAKRGYVDHTYYDHVSLLKFIERNWGLPTISGRSRDTLPNPIASPDNPYQPLNGPAIGDLMSLFSFRDAHKGT